ncbi:CD109 antigen [Harmonia axyridis]|uniref:CD109 antigen n=1 Tax=Harmonia axyridis TaxID=115357 RepID=UPI001E276CF6|nr:CD109 antigen [Harmonia axyridis]
MRILLIYGTLLVASRGRAQVTDSNYQFDPYNPNPPSNPGPPGPDRNGPPQPPPPPNYNPDPQFGGGGGPVQFPDQGNGGGGGVPYGGGQQFDQFGKTDQFGRPDYGGAPPQGPWDNGYNFDRDTATEIKEATYMAVASTLVRPGHLYRVSVTVLQEKQPMVVRASIQRNGVEMSADHKAVKEGIQETLLMRVPSTSDPGEYRLRLEGFYENVLGGSAFVNETKLIFSQRSKTIFIQIEKPFYKQGENVRFRTIPINTELKAYNDAIDVFMLDPSGHIMKRWLSRQSNLGTVSLDYQLSDQPVFGEWKIRIIAQGQTEESTFLVEEYYQTRFEVNVTMPAFFFNTDEYIEGVVMANYTSGGPVSGNLTLKAIIKPIAPIDVNQMINRNRQTKIYNRNEYHEDRFYNNRYDRYGPRYDGRNPYQQNVDQYQLNNDQYQQNTDQNQQNTDQFSTMEKPVVKYLNLYEEFPFWFDIPENNYEPIPHLKMFNGVYHFKYPIRDILPFTPNEGLEVMIVATVGDYFLDEILEGYSSARIYNSSIKLKFVGDSPQVFKPGMPVHSYLVATYHDGSPLPQNKLYGSHMEISANIDMRNGGGRNIAPKEIFMQEKDGVWEYRLDVKRELGLEGSQGYEELSTIRSIKLQANFRDGFGQLTTAELLLLAHFSPNDQHIKLTTSTITPEVGEFMIFHIRSNYYISSFQYLIISKGIVLLADTQDMNDFVSTLAIGLSAEMAPVATMVVWHVNRYGYVTVDSLTFPVNGISRNKFQVFINNLKARTGHEVEVAIYGEPGSYVGVSGIDKSFYTMQAGNELTYGKVISKMATFDENITLHSHSWFSHEGSPDEVMYFPSSSYGIDANRTFQYAGLVVFSDVPLPNRYSLCDATQGWAECLSGRCYRIEKKCDFYMDCDDGTDEAGCNYGNETELALFRKFRFNRLQRQYENVWIWKDINISPHGRYIFNVPVPARPVHWMVSAFSMSPSRGFGMLQRAIEYVGVLPFFINLEMPNTCMQGEQVGLRVTVFNYMTTNVEAQVVLNGSPDYKFVHVEENGVVRAYNPRTSYGEHQFFIFIKAQDAEVVYIPIVPQRLGDITVSVHASTLIGEDRATRTLHVESDGIPQYRHQSVLLDLSNRAFTFQYMHVNITETPMIPYQYDRYYVYGSNKARVSVVGDVVGPIFPTMPVNATSLLHLPMDSAEQNIFSFAANMYTILYMRYTQQRNRTLEKLAFLYMNIGYQRQLSFMQPDGSFSLFRSDWNQSAPSVWVTAYAARIFQEASFYEWENYIYIDPMVIAKAVEWVLGHQNEYGAFYETTWLPDRKYNYTLNIDNDDISHRNITLTAHVLITLEAVKDLTSGLSGKVVTAQKKAIHWLERNMQLLSEKGRPFDVALVAYALMKSKAPNAETAFIELSRRQRFDGGLLYWGRKKIPQPPSKIENQKPFLLPRLPYEYDSENIETTALGLLVYVARQEIYVDNIVRWLNTQRLSDGGWASTSDTAYAMKALIEYTSAQRIRDISSLTVQVEATALPRNPNNRTSSGKIMHVNDKNRAKLQYIDIPNAWGTVKVEARGTGYAILQMSVQYNVDIARFQTPPPVPAFELRNRPVFSGRNQSHITYVTCQRWINLNESERSGMAVLDVTIPTGYIIQQQDLDSYVLSRRVRNLQRARFQERKVLFYFDYLDNEDTCIDFTVERWYPVANMSRFLPIRVYDYYAPERFNETIFDALSTYVLDICQVCGSSQCPYCGIYNSAPIPMSFVNPLLLACLLLLCSYFKT